MCAGPAGTGCLGGAGRGGEEPRGGDGALGGLVVTATGVREAVVCSVLSDLGGGEKWLPGGQRREDAQGLDDTEKLGNETADQIKFI